MGHVPAYPEQSERMAFPCDVVTFSLSQTNSSCAESDIAIARLTLNRDGRSETPRPGAEAGARLIGSRTVSGPRRWSAVRYDGLADARPIPSQASCANG